jgi:hypothetical protein
MVENEMPEIAATLSRCQKCVISILFYLTALPYHIIFLKTLRQQSFQNMSFATVFRDMYRVWLILCNVCFQFDILMHVFACFSLFYAFRNSRTQYGDLKTQPTLIRLKSYITLQQKLIGYLDLFNTHFSNYLSIIIVDSIMLLTLSIYVIPMTISNEIQIPLYFTCIGTSSAGCLLVLLTPLAMLYDEVLKN